MRPTASLVFLGSDQGEGEGEGWDVGGPDRLLRLIQAFVGGPGESERRKQMKSGALNGTSQLHSHSRKPDHHS